MQPAAPLPAIAGSEGRQCCCYGPRAGTPAPPPLPTAAAAAVDGSSSAAAASQILVCKVLTYSDVSTDVARTGRIVLPRIQVGGWGAAGPASLPAPCVCGKVCGEIPLQYQLPLAGGTCQVSKVPVLEKLTPPCMGSSLPACLPALPPCRCSSACRSCCGCAARSGVFPQAPPAAAAAVPSSCLSTWKLWTKQAAPGCCCSRPGRTWWAGSTAPHSSWKTQVGGSGKGWEKRRGWEEGGEMVE